MVRSEIVPCMAQQRTGSNGRLRGHPARQLGHVVPPRRRPRVRDRSTLRISDTARWRCTVIVAGLSLTIALGLLGAAFSSADKVRVGPPSLLAALTACLTLYRLRILKPIVDRRGRSKDYANWRKAMQKPIEAIMGLPLLAAISFLTWILGKAYPGSDPLTSSVSSFMVGIFAWAALAGLIGSAGADASSIKDDSSTPSEQFKSWVWFSGCFGLVLFAGTATDLGITAAPGVATAPGLVGWWRWIPWLICSAALASWGFASRMTRRRPPTRMLVSLPITALVLIALASVPKHMLSGYAFLVPCLSAVIMIVEATLIFLAVLYPDDPLRKAATLFPRDFAWEFKRRSQSSPGSWAGRSPRQRSVEEQRRENELDKWWNRIVPVLWALFIFISTMHFVPYLMSP